VNARKISIITPCYNHAPYLSETIQSVLGQEYPNLEYIIIDGGSTDGSVEMIRQHENHLAYWQSARDNGMYSAINLGMARATGDILGWLNSDDYYLPGTLNFVAKHLNPTAPKLLFGNAFHFVEGRAEHWGSDVEREHARKDILKCDYVIQPASFWTRAVWERAGVLDESYKIVADWEWFARAQRVGISFQPVARYLAAYRILPTSKTQAGGTQRNQECARILREYVSEEYAQTFERVVQQRDAILRIRSWLRRWNLARLEKVVLRSAFPKISARVSIRDVWDMIETIGYSCSR
jgi:glycosyltransferase involved in cell wall biosynthesis